MADTTKLSAPDAPAPDLRTEREESLASRAAVERKVQAAVAAENKAASDKRASAQVAEGLKAAKAEEAAAKKEATSQKSGKGGVLLRYLGTSDVFEDGKTGLRFIAGGTPHEVEPEDATRLESFSRTEQFERERAGDK